ncbi:MAG: dTDP-glucose 4,6-dehydratase [Candidatus Hodarchaeota archaeon]
MILLITGVAGFIGSNFTYYYLDKYKERRIIGLDNLTYSGNIENLSKLTESQKKRFHFIKGDINNRQLVEKIFSDFKIDGVINIAAESHVDRSIFDPQSFLKTNILGTQTLLDVSKKFWLEKGEWLQNKRFLQVSTDEVYGSLGTTGYFTEETPLDPRSPYSASKAASDLIVKAYNTTYEMPIIITRSSNNYGPYQFPEKLIPLMINNALNNKPLPIYGDGRHIRDWLYVLDHCKAMELAFRDGKIGETYNIGSQNEKENIYVVNRIIDLLRTKTGNYKISPDLIQYVEDRPGHDRRYAIDASKIRRELSWRPEISFEKGLDITIQWYLENIDWLNSVISGEYLEYYKKNYGWRS